MIPRSLRALVLVTAVVALGCASGPPGSSLAAGVAYRADPDLQKVWLGRKGKPR